jgi:hypothetical protein
MRIAYVSRDFSPGSLALIARANEICESYAAQGYELTLRQLYYQFVARGWLANADRNYKRLGSVVNDARLAGLIDWDHVVDRTRFVRQNSHWNSPGAVVRSAARGYDRDRWEGQPTRLEVWIEKDALVGVIENVCERNDVPYFSCRGYTSQSEIWGAAQRLEGYLSEDECENVVVLHLGDHDPSGIDMTRDITDRLSLFFEGDGLDPGDLDVRRIALTMDQVEQYNPPPNPAKLTDSRAVGYISRYGRESWELDALNPDQLVSLVDSWIDHYRDADLWASANERVEEERRVLTAAAARWPDVARFLEPA